ncbi:acetylornithine aminotransferase [Azospira oryzae]|uniref:Acetylornithine aminotransferase n=1 Tax=Azospira oryzae TaxID=146939 RepID=A0ABY0IT47_9RHOO|nr:acetylornithine transaminase [Azospira oryzae]RZT90753.1 acetylornithine aminotransferase [Azospira oryzae]
METPFAAAPAANALMWITQRPQLVFAEGRGSWLVDQQGKRYLDFVQGWAVNCLGHGHPAIVETLASQAGKLINPSPAFYNEPSLKLAAGLAAHSCFDRVFFASTGAEANEGAIKLARKWGQKHKGGAHEIITFAGGFHGRTLATMSASGKPGWDTLFAPQVPGFPKAQLNDLDSVAALISERTVAIMLEPIQGEGGVVPARVEFLQLLRQICDDRGLLLIVDEVQTGMGRTGKLFAHQHAGIEPDIMTLGKGIGGGVPLSALLAKESVCCFEAGDQGGTYNGNPLMTAVGVAVLEVLTAPGFLDEVAAKGEHLGAGLQRLSDRLGLRGERGQGLLRALLLADERGPAIVEAARERGPEGLLLNAPRPHLLRFMPSLTVSREEIDQMLAWLEELLRA